VDNYTNWLRPLPYDAAAEHAVKLFVLALAGGAERYFHYWGVYEESLLPRLSGMTLFEHDGSLRPMAVAYAIAGSLLDGTKGDGWVEMPGSVLASLLRDDARLIAVLWRRTGRRPVRLHLPLPLDRAALDARDLMGNPLRLPSAPDGVTLDVGGEPICLVTNPTNGAVLVTVLRDAAHSPAAPPIGR
jgi:hypothetical protein